MFPQLVTDEIRNNLFVIVAGKLVYRVCEVTMSKKPGLSGNGSLSACIHFSAQVLSREGELFPETLTKAILAPIVVDAHRFGLQVAKTIGSAHEAAPVDPRKLLSTCKKLGDGNFNAITVADVTWDFQGSVAETLEMELEELQSRARGTGYNICSLFVINSPSGSSEFALVWIPAEDFGDVSKHSMLLYVCPGRVKVVKTTRDLLRKIHEEMETARERNASYSVWSLIPLPRNQEGSQQEALLATSTSSIAQLDHQISTTKHSPLSPSKSGLAAPSCPIADQPIDTCARRVSFGHQESVKQKTIAMPEQSADTLMIQFSSQPEHHCSVVASLIQAPEPTCQVESGSELRDQNESVPQYIPKANNNQSDCGQTTSSTGSEATPKQHETNDADPTTCSNANSPTTQYRSEVAKSIALNRQQQNDMFPVRLYRSVGGNEMVDILSAKPTPKNEIQTSACPSVASDPFPLTSPVVNSTKPDQNSPITNNTRIQRIQVAEKVSSIESMFAFSIIAPASNQSETEDSPTRYSPSSSVSIRGNSSADQSVIPEEEQLPSPSPPPETAAPKKSARERVRAKIGAKVWWELEYTARQIERQSMSSNPCERPTHRVSLKAKNESEPENCFQMASIVEDAGITSPPSRKNRVPGNLEDFSSLDVKSHNIGSLKRNSENVEKVLFERSESKPFIHTKEVNQLRSSTNDSTVVFSTRDISFNAQESTVNASPTLTTDPVPMIKRNVSRREKCDDQSVSGNNNNASITTKALSRVAPVSPISDAWVEDDAPEPRPRPDGSNESVPVASLKRQKDLNDEVNKSAISCNDNDAGDVDVSSPWRKPSVERHFTKAEISTGVQPKHSSAGQPSNSTTSNNDDLPFHKNGRVPIRGHREKQVTTQKHRDDDDNINNHVDPLQQEAFSRPVSPPPLPPVAVPPATFISLVDEKHAPSTSKRDASAHMDRLNELRQKKLEQLHKARELARQQQEEKKLKQSTRLPGNKLDSNTLSAPIGHAPRVKRPSNRQLLQNAIEYTLLAGAPMERERLAALSALAESSAENFIVLLKSAKELKFRALYESRTDSDEARRIFSVVSSASAPSRLTPDVVAQFFKYSSAKKQFLPVDTRSFTVTTDACALMDQLVFKKTAKPRLL